MKNGDRGFRGGTHPCVGSKVLPNGEEAFGVNISGVPFGDEKYVQAVMGDKVAGICGESD